MNDQTQGPVHVTRHKAGYSIRAKEGGEAFDLVNTGLLNLPMEVNEANARLFAAAYTSYDKAGRELGVDATELAKTIDLAALIHNAQDMLDSLRGMPLGPEMTGIYNQTKEMLAKLPGLT